MWAVGGRLWAVGYGPWAVICCWWCVVYGLWSVVGGLWSVVYGMWSVVYGLWSMVCGLWSVVYGLCSVVCGLRLVVSGVWLEVHSFFGCFNDVQLTCSSEDLATIRRFFVFQTGMLPEQLIRTPPEHVFWEDAKIFLSPQWPSLLAGKWSAVCCWWFVVGGLWSVVYGL